MQIKQFRVYVKHTSHLVSVSSETVFKAEFLKSIF